MTPFPLPPLPHTELPAVLADHMGRAQPQGHRATGCGPPLRPRAPRQWRGCTHRVGELLELMDWWLPGMLPPRGSCRRWRGAPGPPARAFLWKIKQWYIRQWQISQLMNATLVPPPSFAMVKLIEIRLARPGCTAEQYALTRARQATLSGPQDSLRVRDGRRDRLSSASWAWVWRANRSLRP